LIITKKELILEGEKNMYKRKYLLIGIVVITIIMLTVSSLGSNFIDMENAEKQVENTVSIGAELEVTTDKTTYYLGESVTTFLTNVGDEILSAGGPIVTIYNNDNEIVYQEASYCWWQLDPGEYITWLPWDQTNQQGNQVPVGEYIVEGFLSGGGENFIDSAIFFIIDYNSSGPPSGPTEGAVGVEYTFCIKLPDNPECEPYYLIWDWGDGIISEWLGPYVAGEIICETYSWNEPGDYEIHVKIRDGCNNEYWLDPLIIHIVVNNPPNTPTIKGLTSGKVGASYDYTIVAEDSDNTYIWYYIDWDDGSNTGWVGIYISGQEMIISHIFNEQGTYIIKAKAKDIYAAESNWGTIQVKIPRNFSMDNPILRFFEDRPFLYKIFQLFF